MSKFDLKLCLQSTVIGLAVLLSPPMDAADFQGQQTSTPQLDQCTKELLLSYFPEQFVNETLKKYNVPQDKWAKISQSLIGKEKEIIKTVEEKASQMNPNPLKDPQQRQTAVKLFRETLLQVFGDALKANGVTDEKQFNAMLDDIQQQKAKKFAECMKKQDKLTPNTAPKNSDLDDDNDDDDDDDEDDDDEDDSDRVKSNITPSNKSNNAIKK